MKLYLNFLIVFILFPTAFVFSQKITLTYLNNKLPSSIYTSDLLSTDINSTYNINSKLNLHSYKFVFLDETKIEEGYFTIPFENINKTPTKYINDSYTKIYNNLNLKSAFFKVSDLYKGRPKNPF